MEPVAYLRPTALQHIRAFLSGHGADVPPWSSSHEAMDALLGLLHERRGDDAFFARLAPFLDELRAGAARGSAGLAAGDAEVLGGATIESIVSELRDGLRRAPAGASPSALRSLIGDRAAPLVCLALLASGLTGCTQQAAGPGASAEPGTPPPVAPPVAPPVQPKAEPPDAAVPASTDALVEMFRSASPQEAAKALEKAADAGARKRSAIEMFGPRPAYKGVELA